MRWRPQKLEINTARPWVIVRTREQRGAVVTLLDVHCDSRGRPIHYGSFGAAESETKWLNEPQGELL